MEEVFREKDKGVSAIVGTILIVAITVVLAATVYGVLTGFGGLIGGTAPTGALTVNSGSTYTVSLTSLSTSSIPSSNVEVKITYTSGSTTTTYVSQPLSQAGSATAAFDVSADTTTQSTAGLTISSVITISVGATNTGTLSSITAISLIDTSPSGTIASWTAA